MPASRKGWDAVSPAFLRLRLVGLAGQPLVHRSFQPADEGLAEPDWFGERAYPHSWQRRLGTAVPRSRDLTGEQSPGLFPGKAGEPACLSKPGVGRGADDAPSQNDRANGSAAFGEERSNATFEGPIAPISLSLGQIAAHSRRGIPKDPRETVADRGATLKGYTGSLRMASGKKDRPRESSRNIDR
jgi:hypothetical protein